MGGGAWEESGGADTCHYLFISSALDGGEWSVPRPGRLSAGTHGIGGAAPYNDKRRALYKVKICYES